MDVRPGAGPPRPDPPTWLVGLVGLLLAATAVLWPLLSGQTLTEWMRDVTGALLAADEAGGARRPCVRAQMQLRASAC